MAVNGHRYADLVFPRFLVVDAENPKLHVRKHERRPVLFGQVSPDFVTESRGDNTTDHIVFFGELRLIVAVTLECIFEGFECALSPNKSDKLEQQKESQSKITA